VNWPCHLHQFTSFYITLRTPGWVSHWCHLAKCGKGYTHKQDCRSVPHHHPCGNLCCCQCTSKLVFNSSSQGTLHKFCAVLHCITLWAFGCVCADLECASHSQCAARPTVASTFWYLFIGLWIVWLQAPRLPHTLCAKASVESYEEAVLCCAPQECATSAPRYDCCFCFLLVRARLYIVNWLLHMCQLQQFIWIPQTVSAVGVLVVYLLY